MVAHWHTLLKQGVNERETRLFRASGIRHSFDIRHSSFVIAPSPSALPYFLPSLLILYLDERFVFASGLFNL
jgi:hypothetical protein